MASSRAWQAEYLEKQTVLPLFGSLMVTDVLPRWRTVSFTFTTVPLVCSVVTTLFQCILMCPTISSEFHPHATLALLRHIIRVGMSDGVSSLGPRRLWISGIHLKDSSFSSVLTVRLALRLEEFSFFR